MIWWVQWWLVSCGWTDLIGFKIKHATRKVLGKKNQSTQQQPIENGKRIDKNLNLYGYIEANPDHTMGDGYFPLLLTVDAKYCLVIKTGLIQNI